MAGAITGYPARHNLASLGYKIIEDGRIFIINLYIRIRTKTAEFLLMKKLFLGYRFGLSPFGIAIAYSPFVEISSLL